MEWGLKLRVNVILRSGKTCGADNRSVEIKSQPASKFADGEHSDVAAVPVLAFRSISQKTIGMGNR